MVRNNRGLMETDIAASWTEDRGKKLPSLHRGRRGKDAVWGALIVLSASLTVLVLVGLLAYILIQGLPHLSWNFLTGTYSAIRKEARGILPMIINTLYIVVITLLIVTPVGVSAAIYLTQYARQGRLVRTIRFATEILSGVPSVLFGLFGFTFFCVMMGMGTSILAGCLTMAVCILPVIVRTTEEALLAVPDSYREGALALGAGKLRVVLGVVLPCAMPGVLTAVILGMGRIVGESAALIFTSGLATEMPRSVFGHVLDSARTLTLHLYQVSMEPVAPNAFDTAYATAAVLLILVFLLNRLAGLLSRALKKG